MPTDPIGRLNWQHRAGTVAAWRELAGHTDPADALGAPAPPGQPEHYATWRAAWTALGQPEVARHEAELSKGQLRIRVRAMEREENWAPAYVGESLTAATLRADARRRDAGVLAGVLAAHASAAAAPADAELLRRAADDAAAETDVLDRRVAQLTEADGARSTWLLHTAVTRDAADRARAELASRGAAVSAEAGDAVTPAEWLAAHQTEAVVADRHRPITGTHDLADVSRQREADLAAAAGPTDEAVAETGLPDIREADAEDVPDERGRIPDAETAEVAVRRAQAALREIEQRREQEQRREDEEARSGQLSRWAADDADETADEHVAAL